MAQGFSSSNTFILSSSRYVQIRPPLSKHTQGKHSEKVILKSKSSLESSESSSDEEEFFMNSVFRERASKIAEMGGDPSFISYEDDNEEDDAYFGIDGEAIDEQESMNFTPSLSFMNQMESSPNTLEHLLDRTASASASASSSKKYTSTTPNGIQDQSSGGSMHMMEDDDYGVTEFDLEEIGGDPAFLEKEDSDDLWDGAVDEDAHFDFF